MSDLFERLSWLPPAPSDFAEKVAAAVSGRELRDLSKFALDENQLRRLAKKHNALRTQQADLVPLTSMTLGIISNSTTKLIAPPISGTALRFGVALHVIEAEYNQVAQEAFSEASSFQDAKVDVMLLALDYRGLPFVPCPGNQQMAQEGLQHCVQYLRSLIQAIRAKTGAQILLQNFAPPAEAMMGSFEIRLPGTMAWLLDALNAEINHLASDDTFILDVAGLAAQVGLLNWHDPVQWNLAKLPFAQKFVPIYAEHVCRVLAAKLGKSRRCLILDLDNTLWGGVIGDDGVEGIRIGNGDAIGEAHLHVQKIALELRERGVVLAVCSKNEDAAARLPFKEHPEMLLREEHIAVFQANWTDKASNIKAIAEMLSLGLESMVFLDDNPAERMQVRKELPEVAVPELPEDASLYARTLLAGGYFEAITFSEEDRKRAGFYQDNARRVQTLNQSSDMHSYLKSLAMEMAVTPFDATGRARIAQLISKSNQFNLTTRRYSEADVKAIEEDESCFARQIRLKDVFGDNGMISVIVCRKSPQAWEIDTWLMSCRVLGRRVEEAALQEMIRNAAAEGCKTLIGKYIPTARNTIVKDHYKKLGFSLLETDSAGSETWQLDLAQYEMAELPMTFVYDAN